MRLGLNFAATAALCLALGACSDDTETGGGGSGGGSPSDGGSGGLPSTGGNGGEGGDGGAPVELKGLGESCATNDECDGGVCLTEEVFGWAQGYCTALCDPTIAPCETGLCLGLGDSNFCILECEEVTDCPGVGNSCIDVDTEAGPVGVCAGGCTEDAQCNNMNCVIEPKETSGFCIPPEVCAGGEDEDGDGFADCADADCSADATCVAAIDEACTGATALTDGVEATGSNSAGTSLFAGVCESIFGPSVTGLGAESVYSFTATATGVLTVTATADSGDFALYARTDCADGSTQIQCSDVSFDPGEDEVVEVNVATGDVVTLFVDAYQAGAEGDFSIIADFVAVVCGDNVTAGLEQCDDGNTTAGDGCSATCQLEPTNFCAQDVVNILAGVPANGNTANGTDGFAGSCGSANFSGGEVVYRYTPLLTGTATVTVAAGDAHDPVLYVRSDCDDPAAAAELECVDAGFSPGDDETLMVPVTGGTPIFIFVDSYSDAVEGSFTLTVTQ